MADKHFWNIRARNCDKLHWAKQTLILNIHRNAPDKVKAAFNITFAKAPAWSIRTT